MNQSEVLEEFFSDLSLEVEHVTIESYRDTLGHLVRWADGRSIFEFEAPDLNRFLRRPRREAGGGSKPPAAATVRREHATLSKFFKWAAVSGEVELPKRFRRQLAAKLWKPDAVNVNVPNPVSDNAWDTLWLAELDDEWDRVWLGLAYFLGFRKIEFVSVGPDAFNFDAGTVHFLRKGRRWHTLAFVELLESDLRPHLIGRTTYLDHWLDLLVQAVKERNGQEFLSPRTKARTVEYKGESVRIPHKYSLTYYNKHSKFLLKVAGLPLSSMTPHRLRHSTATNLYRAGVPMVRIASLLNHSDMEMTRKYADVSAEFTEYRKRHLHGTVAELAEE